jgi:hypothetical protein
MTKNELIIPAEQLNALRKMMTEMFKDVLDKFRTDINTITDRFDAEPTWTILEQIIKDTSHGQSVYLEFTNKGPILQVYIGGSEIRADMDVKFEADGYDYDEYSPADAEQILPHVKALISELEQYRDRMAERAKS